MLWVCIDIDCVCIYIHIWKWLYTSIIHLFRFWFFLNIYTHTQISEIKYDWPVELNKSRTEKSKTSTSGKPCALILFLSLIMTCMHGKWKPALLWSNGKKVSRSRGSQLFPICGPMIYHACGCSRTFITFILINFLEIPKSMVLGLARVLILLPLSLSLLVLQYWIFEGGK